ncbi:MAG: hypothetical protein K6F00_08500 [Lachnospiraceae bacterium]|nr:hypothetical protein [Lachnospiraceae bacterium]
MFHKKKTAAVLLFLTLAVGLCGCGVDYEKQDELKASGIKKLESYQPKEALADFEKAIALAGTKATKSEVDLCYYKGTAQTMMGEYDDAIETYDGLISYDDKDEKAYFLRACVKVKAGDISGAKDDYETAFRLTEDGDVYFYGFTQLMTEGYKVEAMEFYEETKDSIEDTKRLFYEQIAIYEEKGDFDKAREAASQYLALDADNKAVGREYDFLEMLK